MGSLPQLEPDSRSSKAETLRRIASALQAAAAALEVIAEDQPVTLIAAPSDGDPLLTVDEAAAFLKRTAKHVRAQCRSGAIRAMRDGRGWRIRQSALVAYERRRTK